MSDPTALPAFGFQTPPAESLHQRVLSTLTAMNANPSVDDDGDIRVSVEDQMLFIRTMDGDLPFMRIFGQWQVGDEVTVDLAEQVNIANRMTILLNLIKVGVHEPAAAVDAGGQETPRLVIAAADVLVSPGMALDHVLANCMVGILNSVRTWHAAASGIPLEEAIAQQAAAAQAAAAEQQAAANASGN